MEVIQISPANQIAFKIPTGLTCKFKVGNLTLRSLCMYIVSLHPNFISVDIKNAIIDPFQEVQVIALLHWSQQINCVFKSKLRVYIWQLYDEQSISSVVTKMFNKDSDGNNLHFAELVIDVDVDEAYLQKINPVLPLAYSISRVSLPNNSGVNVTAEMMGKVLNYCEKVEEVKAIYTYELQYVVEFSQIKDVICEFCEIRNNDDKLAIFGIACIPTLGNIIYSPSMLILTYVKSESPKAITKKQKSISNIKEKSTSNVQDEPQAIKKLNTNPSIQQSNNNGNNQQQLNAQQEEHHHQKAKIPANRGGKHREVVKQSMAVYQKNRGFDKKRSKSQERVFECDFENQSIQIDVNRVNEWRTAHDFELRKPQHFQEKFVDFSKKILNIALSIDEKQVYILFRGCIVVCDTENIANRRTLKFEPIDSENVHLPTPMIIVNKQKMAIFGNDSYLFWVSLTAEQGPEWKYVQRKQIHTIQVVEQLNLLIVGGKNFSKLSYLGKSTNRCNIKIYSCGKHGKREHLFTFDIPQCNSENVQEMKYIATKPNGTKLLLVITNQSTLIFLRVKAFNHIEIYSHCNSFEIGIQEIVSMNYHIGSSILVFMEKLSQEHYCLKYIKVICAYQKVQIFTESIKLPVEKYLHQFRMGGKEGNEWITTIDSKNCIYSLYLQWKQPTITQYRKTIKDCLLMKKGAIFREDTQIMSRIITN